MNWFKKLARQLGQRGGERSPTPTARTAPTRLGVERMEDRLTPATVTVTIPALGITDLLVPKDIVIGQTATEYYVARDNNVLARGSLNGVDELLVIGSVDQEQFVIPGPGLPVSLLEGWNDQIALLGSDADATAPVADHIIASDRWAWVNGRSVGYQGVAERINVFGRGGDDTLVAASRSVPVRMEAGAGNDTLIVQQTGYNVVTPNIPVIGGSTPVAVYLNGQGGTNTYVLGYASPTDASGAAYNDASNLDRLIGNVYIDATGGSSDWLYAYDKGDTSANNYRIQNDRLTRAGGAAQVIYNGLDGVTLQAGSGDDLILASQTSLPVRLYGNGGHDIVLGGLANDYLDGGSGSDILVGGIGADELHGGAGQDILVGGSFNWSTDTTSLNALRTAWTDGSLSYSTRVAQLRPSLTDRVREDTSRDQLWGEGDMDWFWGTWSTGSDNEVRDRLILLSPYFTPSVEAVR